MKTALTFFLTLYSLPLWANANPCSFPQLEQKCKKYNEATGTEENLDESCEEAHFNSQKCCSDPVKNCFSSQKVSTFNEISKTASLLGGAGGSALQDMGASITGLCETALGLTGASAGLVLYAKKQCTNKINTCSSTCHQDAYELCKKGTKEGEEQGLLTIKTHCQRALQQKLATFQIEQFRKQAQKTLEKIEEIEALKSQCETAHKAIATKLHSEWGSLLASGISAGACIMKASMIKTQKECDKAGGEWIPGLGGGKCKIPEPEFTAPPVDPPQDSPNDSSHHSSHEIETSGENSSNDNVGGGGGKRKPNPPSAFNLNPFGGKAGQLGHGTGTQGLKNAMGGKNKKQTKNKAGGIGKSPLGETEEEEKSKQKKAPLMGLGGGGFGGYAGATREDRPYNNRFGLSKKQKAELKKKQKAKRKLTGVEGGDIGGAHMSIFERVSRRVQFFCQKRTLTCP